MLSAQREDEASSLAGRAIRMSPDQIALHRDDQPLDTGLYYRSTTSFRGQHIPACLKLSVAGSERWRLPAPIFNDLPPQQWRGWRIMTTDRLSNWPELNAEDGPLSQAAFILAGTIYGGLHALAWNAPFPTGAEQLLWRLSASMVIGYGMLISLAISFVNLLCYLFPNLLPFSHYSTIKSSKNLYPGIKDVSRPTSI